MKERTPFALTTAQLRRTKKHFRYHHSKSLFAFNWHLKNLWLPSDIFAHLSFNSFFILVSDNNIVGRKCWWHCEFMKKKTNPAHGRNQWKSHHIDHLFNNIDSFPTTDRNYDVYKTWSPWIKNKQTGKCIRASDIIVAATNGNNKIWLNKNVAGTLIGVWWWTPLDKIISKTGGIALCCMVFVWRKPESLNQSMYECELDWAMGEPRWVLNEMNLFLILNQIINSNSWIHFNGELEIIYTYIWIF